MSGYRGEGGNNHQSPSSPHLNMPARSASRGQDRRTSNGHYPSIQSRYSEQYSHRPHPGRETSDRSRSQAEWRQTDGKPQYRMKPAGIPVDHHHQHDLESQHNRHSRPVVAEKTHSSSTESSGQRQTPSISLGSRLSKWSPSEDTIHNAIMGTSDGMTVPFAVTASLAGVTDARLVMLAGLAELIAGAISMAAGGVLGAKSDKERYDHQVQHLENLIATEPNAALGELTDSLEAINLPPHIVVAISKHYQTLANVHEKAVMIKRFDVEEVPSRSDTWKAAATFFFTYFAGLLPLLPYFIVPSHEVNRAFKWSIGITAVLSFLFGAGKTMYNMRGSGMSWWRRWGWTGVVKTLWGGWVMCGVIAAAAVIGVVIIRAVNGSL